MINQQFIDRIDALPDVFMLASLVQFKYVQTISELNDVNFVVGLAGGYEVFGTPEQVIFAPVQDRQRVPLLPP